MKTDNTMTAREKFLEVMGYDGPPWIIGLMESHAEALQAENERLKATFQSPERTERLIKNEKPCI